MGNNDWGVPTPNTGNPWGPGNQPGQPEQKPGRGAGVFISVAVVAIAALVVAGVFIWNQFGGDGEDGDTQAGPNFTSVEDPSDAAETTEAEAAPTPQEQDPTPTASPTSTRPAPDDDDGDADGDLRGDTVTSQGFRGVPEARCNGNDQWIFAGTNGEDRAVICRVGERGGLYYRGFYNDGGAEHDIDPDRTGNGAWETYPTGSLRIEISHDGVRVLTADGNERSGRSFTWSSEDNGG